MFKSISFQISQLILLFFYNNIPQVIKWKLGFINRNYGPANHILCEKG